MKSIILSLLLVLSFVVFGYGQEAKNTKNSADQMLRSNGTVNPSTLGLEMNISLGSYSGRGINLPLSLNYSSKLWRFEAKKVWVTPSSCPPWNPSCLLPEYGSVWTYVDAQFSEDAAAGWTSSIAEPYIEYTGEYTIFNGAGNPVAEYPDPLPTPPEAGGRYVVKRITVYLPGGISYELRDGDLPIPTHQYTSSDGVYLSADGSGVKYIECNLNSTLAACQNFGPLPVYRLYMTDGSFYDFGTGEKEDRQTTYDYESRAKIRRAARLTDPHGNFITFDEPPTDPALVQTYPYGSITDQLGRKFPVMVPRENLTAPTTQSFTLPGMTGAYTLNWQPLSTLLTPGKNHLIKKKGNFDHWDVYTSFPGPTLFPSHGQNGTCNSDELVVLADQVESGSAILFNPIVLADIKLPNGAKYQFTYNEYGEIEQIIYPTGGREEMIHGQLPSLAQQTLPYENSNRGVIQRDVYESITDPTYDRWEYSALSSPNNYRTRITAPDLSRTDRFMHRGVPAASCAVHPAGTFPVSGFEPRWGYDNVLAGRAYDERVFSFGGELVQRTLTRWEKSFSDVDMVPYQNRKVEFNLRVAWTENITYEGNNGVGAVTKFVYADTQAKGSPLNVTDKKEYSFIVETLTGLPSATPDPLVVTLPTPSTGDPVCVTHTDYKTDPVYLARGFLKLPVEVVIKDETGNIKAKSQIVYDAPTYLQPDPAGSVPGWSAPEVPAIRGLPTTTKSWYEMPNQFVQTRVQYNQFGSPRITWDGNGNASEIQYNDNFSDGINRSTFAFATKTISTAPGGNGSTEPFQTQTKYRFETGQPVSTKDINNQETTMEYDDPLLRLRKVTAPNGQQTITEYGLPETTGALAGQYLSGQRFVKVSSAINGNNHWEQDFTWFDGLGRTKQTKSIDDDGDVFVDTEYDNMGRVKKVSNPYRSGDTIYWTENTYDALDRITKVKTSGDQAELNTAYSVATTGSQIGIVETVTDEADKTRRTIEDAFDNLIRVDEPDLNGNLGNIGSPIQPTVYTYDANENLKQIVQGGQTRSFEYNALNRLTRATNPESGTFQYTYDLNGNLITKIDARGISTMYSYDGLNRITVKDYSDSTPDVTFHYDASSVQNSKLRLTKVSSSASQTLFTSFDANGNILGSQQITNGQTYDFGYTYNLNDNLLTQTYPSSKVVRFEYDESGELSRVKRTMSFSYAQSIQYTPSGEIEQIRFGNNRWETTKFNPRRQIKEIGLGYSANDTGIWKTNYEYGAWQDTTLNSQKNNGSLARQTILVPNIANVNGFTATQTYTYDPLDRLKSAAETTNGSPTWKQTFLYDRFGNKNYDTSNGNTTTLGSCLTAVCNPSANLADNKLTDYGYDSVGNITTDAEGRTFTYDAENRQITATGTSLSTIYAYDGNGKRVRSHNSITNQTTFFVYDADGQLAAEYTLNVSPPLFPTISYLTDDALGSQRVITNAYGELKARRDFFPFGDEIHIGYGSRNVNQRYSAPDDDTRQKFATYQRDTETGLDFAQSRYYSSRHGRFTSPDEFKGGPDELFDFMEDASSNPTFYADLSNPQSLNKYQYTYNNPYKFNDPSGHCPWCIFFGRPIAFPHPRILVPRPIVVPKITPIVKPLPPIDIIPPFTPIPIFPPKAAPATQPQAQPQAPPPPNQMAHPKKKQSTGSKKKNAPKHDKGTARKKADAGGEKGDARRIRHMQQPRKRPKNWKGPWPPKPPAPKPKPKKNPDA